MNKTLYILSFLFFTISNSIAQVSKSADLPNWIEKPDYNNAPNVNMNEVSQGNLVLLYDKQVNIDKQESYSHLVTKITENVGVQPASSIEITFDPSYQTLTIHSINIIRKDTSIDKLSSSDFQTLRKEANSESYIYDGSLSAFTHISDVRTGDIVEYSYTIKGFNPIHKNNFATFFNVQTSTPLGKLYIQLISSTPLSFKYFETYLKMTKGTKEKHHSYTLSKENIPAYQYEEETPVSHISSGLINVSTPNKYQKIIEWGIPLFSFNDNPSSALNEKINFIKKNNKFEGEKINATLKFVQNEIRYLGLESGIGAYKPFSPNKIFDQRFGDCKDKSFLMVTMLNEMGIEAYPVLINTYFKDKVTELLPAAQNFNHCVVKVIDSSKNELWYDPTISNQGGSFDKVSFPDYRYGLVLKKGNTSLEKIPTTNTNHIETINSFVLDPMSKGASLSIMTIHHQAEADYMRLLFKNSSLTSIQEAFETYYAEKYGSLVSLETPKFEDDSIRNTFTLYENYQIDSLWQPSINKDEIVAAFAPNTIIDVLTMPTKTTRKTPYALLYPISRKQTITIQMPFYNPGLEIDDFNINSKYLYYNKDVNFNKTENLLTIEHTYKPQAYAVPAEDFPDFLADIKQIDSQISYNIISPKNGTPSTVKQASSLGGLYILGSLIFFGFVSLFIWVAFKLYKYNPTPKIESYFEPNKKIGGWLIVLGVFLVIACIKVFTELFMYTEFITGKWLVMLTKNFKFSFALYILFTVVLRSLLLVYYPLAIVLFLKKRSSFPRIHIFFSVIPFLSVLIEAFLFIDFSDVSYRTEQNISIVLASFIGTAAIIPYLLLSERVKETFIKTLS